MTLLPILSPWLYLGVAVLLLAGTAWLLIRGASAARWRLGALLVLVLLAGARPGLVGGSAPVANTELNVFFVVDVTPSIAAEDYNGKSPRLEGVKSDIRALSTELAGARFSMISFDSVASVVLPLTTDATALDTMTEVLSPKPAYISKGSSISAANTLLAQRLAAARQSHPERPRLVFYLGDGEQTAEAAPEPFKDNEELIDGGAVLGYGTAAGGQMREFSFSSSGKPGPYILDKTAGYEPAISKIDEKALAGVAAALNVPYVHRAQPGNIADALEKSAPKSAAQTEAAQDRSGAGRKEIYWLLALAAFGIAGWELISLNRTVRQIRGTGKERS